MCMYVNGLGFGYGRGLLVVVGKDHEGWDGTTTSPINGARQ
jgi:hypothetical protein